MEDRLRSAGCIHFTQATGPAPGGTPGDRAAGSARSLSRACGGTDVAASASLHSLHNGGNLSPPAGELTGKAPWNAR